MLRYLLLATALATPLATPAFAQDWPRTLPHEGGELTLTAPPQRIVSTSPSLTGILLAMDVPLLASTAATRTPLTDENGFFTQWADVAVSRDVAVLYPNLTFDIEALMIAAPDLIIGASTGADSIVSYLPDLQAMDMPVFVLNYSNHSWQDLARQIGAATGHEAGAEAAIARFDAEMAAIRAQLPAGGGRVTVVGYNLGGSYSIGRTESPQARVVEALGFDILPLPEALRPQVSRSSDFDFISHEYLSAAIEGENVFLFGADQSGVAAFMADPVLANLPAVQAGRVYALGLSSFRVDYYSGLQMAHLVADALTQ
ncbi:Fe2+-enterobactin ABC transporter substrate-binding protein [Ketogulonicigenium vulgare]|uniref:Fe2+-enterobactin ABC transporter substrate-binding protein n=1 Tax=Ketogulonicigenium vulgare TaxID=92945 RepID=UPI00235966F1|nr:Fe2+-enterobactin ABC transporter substrate-binding protein [Ketogulonicigenium vulgare]